MGRCARCGMAPGKLRSIGLENEGRGFSTRPCQLRSAIALIVLQLEAAQDEND
jgi:hypothetical protein